MKNNRIYALYMLIVVFLFALFLANCSAQNARAKILVFSATKGYRHKSIAAGVTAFEKLALMKKFVVDASEDPDKFTAENLKKYKAVVFLNTTGSFFNDEQKAAFKQFMENGGGFVGIHSAADTFYDWPWYGKMVGAYFLSHPKIQTATLQVNNKEHPATVKLPAKWQHKDEWYNFKSISGEIRVLMTVDEKSYTGGENGADHPISWYHTYNGGRVFYTALGHTVETYHDDRFLDHLWGGLKWAMGDS